MVYNARTVLSVLTVILVALVPVSTAQQRPITVEDSVRTRRILPGLGQSSMVQLSPDGSRVAYVVKNPNVVTNRNDYKLYIRDLNQIERRDNGRIILQADQISEIKWLGPDQVMAQVGRSSDKGMDSERDIVNTSTGEFTKLQFPVPVAAISISSDGKVIAFSTVATPKVQTAAAQSKQQSLEARGYPVIFGKGRGDSGEGNKRGQD